MLNAKEKRILTDFLEQLSDYLSNEGCNDWEFPDDWSESEKKKFVKQFHEMNNSMDDYDPDDLNIPDFCVLSLLRRKLNK